MKDVEEPIPDLLDRDGRPRRFFAAFAVGVAIAIGVGVAMYRNLHPSRFEAPYDTPSPWRIIVYVAFMMGAASFALTAMGLSWLARRRERANVLPRAQVRK
jgi:hypothetical protein